MVPLRAAIQRGEHVRPCFGSGQRIGRLTASREVDAAARARAAMERAASVVDCIRAIDEV